MINVVTRGNRVRENTSKALNLKIDQTTFENIKYYSKRSEEEISNRIKELDEEWDIERVLGVNMSVLALSGVALSSKNRKWLILPAVILGFFAQHALQGWCPPVPFFRKMKVRTRNEINQEKHALKALRGDYSELRSAEEAFIAVRE